MLHAITREPVITHKHTHIFATSLDGSTRGYWNNFRIPDTRAHAAPLIGMRRVEREDAIMIDLLVGSQKNVKTRQAVSVTSLSGNWFLNI
jgi:hypothetical protein